MCGEQLCPLSLTWVDLGFFGRGRGCARRVVVAGTASVVTSASTAGELSTDRLTFSSSVDDAVDNLAAGDPGAERGGDPSAGAAAGRRYFHWVETAKPPAMKPKPTTMFQFPSDLTGSDPSVT
ncbi:hypothetical protein SCWH03_27660 [Streptomyces pacificus]|uniref:Uncharacterized protein n=1 Tax=Streptomyces pacificus TaxID=2705029 RepID=A0A6A0AY66_9ACTN|nr:hypothetical protein SCWH03_27660 [Streptomyces pacificus]